jgi:hypothetical protein
VHPAVTRTRRAHQLPTRIDRSFDIWTKRGRACKIRERSIGRISIDRPTGPAPSPKRPGKDRRGSDGPVHRGRTFWTDLGAHGQRVCGRRVRHRAPRRARALQGAGKKPAGIQALKGGARRADCKCKRAHESGLDRLCRPTAAPLHDLSLRGRGQLPPIGEEARARGNNTCRQGSNPSPGRASLLARSTSPPGRRTSARGTGLRSSDHHNPACEPPDFLPRSCAVTIVPPRSGAGRRIRAGARPRSKSWEESEAHSAPAPPTTTRVPGTTDRDGSPQRGFEPRFFSGVGARSLDA